MPGIATTIFLPCAAAGTMPARAVSRTLPATNAMVLRNMESSLKSLFFSFSAFEMEFGFAGFPHQRAPHALTQFGKTRLAQRFTRPRLRKINGDGLMDARR